MTTIQCKIEIELGTNQTFFPLLFPLFFYSTDPLFFYVTFIQLT